MFAIQIEDHCRKLISALQKSFEGSSNIDCTLACEGRAIKCHKYLLAAFSDYFSELINGELRNQKSIFIYVSNMKADHLSILINSMYYGRFEVPNDQLPELLRSAQSLGFTHLCNTDLWTFKTTKADRANESDTSHADETSDGSQNMTTNESIPKHTRRTTDSRVMSNASNSNAGVSPSQGQGKQDDNRTATSNAAVPSSASLRKQLGAPSGSEVAAIPRMTPPELLTKANSILTRCLDLISKPVSSSGSESDRKTNQTLAELSKSLQSITRHTDMKPPEPVKNMSPPRRKSDQAVTLAGSTSLGMDMPTSLPSRIEGTCGQAQNLSTECTARAFRPLGQEQSPVSPTWMYQQTMAQNLTGDKSRLLPALEKELQPRRSNTSNAGKGYINYDQINQYRRMNMGPTSPVRSPEMGMVHQPFARPVNMDPRLSQGGSGYMPAVITPYTAVRYSQRFDVSSSYQTGYPSKPMESAPRQHVAVPVENSNQRYSESISQADTVKLLKSKDPFQDLITAKSRSQIASSGRTASVSPVAESHRGEAPNGSATMYRSVSASPTSSAMEGIRRSPVEMKKLVLYERDPNPVFAAEEERARSGGGGDHQNSHLIQSLKSAVESSGGFQSPGASSNHTAEVMVSGKDEQPMGANENERTSQLDDCSNPSVMARGGTANTESPSQPPYKKRKGTPPNTKSTFLCNDCGKALSSYMFLQEHIRVKHKQSKLICEEPGCNYEVLERNKFNSHLVEAHGKQSRQSL